MWFVCVGCSGVKGCLGESFAAVKLSFVLFASIVLCPVFLGVF